MCVYVCVCVCMCVVHGVIAPRASAANFHTIFDEFCTNPSITQHDCQYCKNNPCKFCFRSFAANSKPNISTPQPTPLLQSRVVG